MLHTKRLNIVDGYGYVFRAYYALPPLSAPDGEAIGCVFGFCKMLLSLLHERKGEPFVVVLDTGQAVMRNKIYPEYKANRKEAPDDLKSQFPIIREACIALGIEHIEEVDYEADDIIATLAHNFHEPLYIISSDKDFMQLFRGTCGYL